MIEVEINSAQSFIPHEAQRWEKAIHHVLVDGGIASAQISVAVVDDATIHQLNRQYLNHDCPTDVITFPLAGDSSHVEGEIVASAETAARCAAELSCPPADELLLYLVHGALHLVGYDDLTTDGRQEMRARERQVLERFGVCPRWESPPSGAIDGDRCTAGPSHEGEPRS